MSGADWVNGASVAYHAAFCGFLILLGGPASSAAQGNGRHGPPPFAPGQSKNTTGTSAGQSNTASTTPLADTAVAASRRLQTFGSWLDTAAVNAPGEAWMWVSTAYWRSPTLREIDAPAIGLSVGVAPRMQVGANLPYYFLTDQSGFTSHGFGASYVTMKFAVAQNHRVNISTSPTLEILSWRAPNVRRVNFVLPISAQTQAGALRLYGSTGYFSRGSVFGSGAAEWSASSSVTLAATIAHSYSVASDAVSDALGVTRHRTDAGGSVYLSVGPTAVFFASVGRTFAPVNETSGRIAVTAGLSVNVAGPSTNAPREP